jgi:ribosomal-protein-serine acetyltransferase
MHRDGSIETEWSLLVLAPLSADGVESYDALLDRNRRHLTRHGNYRDALTAARSTVKDELNATTDSLVLGVWLARALIGRIDLIPKEPGIFVIGYWLGHDVVGHGYMTMACRALLAHARAVLDVVTVYAGVRKGNRASEAVLERLGFVCVQNMGTYHRFRLDLDR